MVPTTSQVDFSVLIGMQLLRSCNEKNRHVTIPGKGQPLMYTLPFTYSKTFHLEKNQPFVYKSELNNEDCKGIFSAHYKYKSPIGLTGIRLFNVREVG